MVRPLGSAATFEPRLKEISIALTWQPLTNTESSTEQGHNGLAITAKCRLFYGQCTRASLHLTNIFSALHHNLRLFIPNLPAFPLRPAQQTEVYPCLPLFLFSLSLTDITPNKSLLLLFPGIHFPEELTVQSNHLFPVTRMLYLRDTALVIKAPEEQSIIRNLLSLAMRHGCFLELCLPIVLT